MIVHHNDFERLILDAALLETESRPIRRGFGLLKTGMMTLNIERMRIAVWAGDPPRYDIYEPT